MELSEEELKVIAKIRDDKKNESTRDKLDNLKNNFDDEYKLILNDLLSKIEGHIKDYSILASDLRNKCKLESKEIIKEFSKPLSDKDRSYYHIRKFDDYDEQLILLDKIFKIYNERSSYDEEPSRFE